MPQNPPGEHEDLRDIALALMLEISNGTSVILGFSEESSEQCNEIKQILAESGPLTTTTEKLIPLVKDIHESMEIIGKEIEEIRKVSRNLNQFLFPQETLEIASLDMNAIVHSIVEDMQTMIAESGVTITIESLPQCNGDARQITKVFHNLLDNAVRYMNKKSGGMVRVSGQASDENDSYYIEDNGPGIPIEKQQHLFRISQRRYPISLQAKHSNGLGLSVARKILQRHSGSICLKSSKGKGCLFKLTIPIENRENSIPQRHVP